MRRGGFGIAGLPGGALSAPTREVRTAAQGWSAAYSGGALGWAAEFAKSPQGGKLIPKSIDRACFTTDIAGITPSLVSLVTHYVRMLVEGNKFSEIADFLNQNQYVDSQVDPGNVVGVLGK